MRQFLWWLLLNLGSIQPANPVPVQDKVEEENRTFFYLLSKLEQQFNMNPRGSKIKLKDLQRSCLTKITLLNLENHLYNKSVEHRLLLH